MEQYTGAPNYVFRFQLMLIFAKESVIKARIEVSPGRGGQPSLEITLVVQRRARTRHPSSGGASLGCEKWFAAESAGIRSL